MVKSKIKTNDLITWLFYNQKWNGNMRIFVHYYAILLANLFSIILNVNHEIYEEREVKIKFNAYLYRVESLNSLVKLKF